MVEKGRLSGYIKGIYRFLPVQLFLLHFRKYEFLLIFWIIVITTITGHFAASFGDADHVIVVDIFRSREAPDPAVSAGDIVRRMSHPDARYIPALVDAANYLCEQLKPGDVLLTLGAGDGDVVGHKVLAALEEGATG